MDITICRSAWFAPLIALALLLLLPDTSSESRVKSEAILARNALVARVFRAAPYRIGNWLGEDVEVPSAAIEILRPNAILSRRFTHLKDGRLASFYIIHCSDARDMGGHFPPVCYPAQGWVLDTQQTCEVSIEEDSIPMRVYQFHGGVEFAQQEQLRVFNFFVQRDGDLSAERPRINYLRERHS